MTNLDPESSNSCMNVALSAPKLMMQSKNSLNSCSATKLGVERFNRFLIASESMEFEFNALLCKAHSPDNTATAVNSVVRKATSLVMFNAFEMRAQAPAFLRNDLARQNFHP